MGKNFLFGRIWMLVFVFGYVSGDVEEPWWLLVTSTEILKVELIGNQGVTRILKGLSNSVAADFDYKDQYLFFTDIRDDVIKRVNLNDGSNSVTIVTGTNVRSAEGIAVDWIANNIYWTDSESNGIFVCRYDGSNQRQLVDTGIDHPRAIALSPTEGYMWWAEVGDSPKLEWAWMDGSNRQAIITTDLGGAMDVHTSKNKRTKIMFRVLPHINLQAEITSAFVANDRSSSLPNGLTIDYATRHLFWADARLDKIERSNFDGSNRIVMLSDVPHPFGLTVYNIHIFWTDWLLGKMELAIKVDGSSRTAIAHGLFNPRALHVVSKYKQTGSNACAVEKGGCAGLCLMRAGNMCPICQPEGTELVNCNDDLEVKLIVADSVDDGDHTVLTCHATRGGFVVTPDTYTWKYEGQTIGGQNGRTLVKNPVRPADSGMYECDAMHRGENVADTEVLNVYYAPSAIHWFGTPGTFEVMEHKEITLWCRAEESFPFVSPKFHKLLDGTKSIHEATSFKMVPGVYFGKKVEVGRTITPTRSDNGAVYWCSAEFSYLSGNILERKTTRKALSVLYPLGVDIQVTQPVKEGASMTLVCQSSGGNPPAADSYMWRLNGRVLIGENGPTLSRYPVRRTDGGTYDCDISSRGGTGTDSQVVEVFYPPILNVKVYLQSMKEGDHVSLSCSMTTPGNPVTVISYSWSYNGQVIPGVKGPTLLRSPITRYQSGEYSCTALNQAGSSTASTTLDVKYPPDVRVTVRPDPVIEGRDMEITCETSGGNPTTVASYVWTFNGQILHSETGRTLRMFSAAELHSGTYICTATSDGGQNSAQRTITVRGGDVTTPVGHSTTFKTPTVEPHAENGEAGQANPLLIAVIVLAVVLALLVAAGIGYCIFKCIKEKKSTTSSDSSTTQPIAYNSRPTASRPSGSSRSRPRTMEPEAPHSNIASPFSSSSTRGTPYTIMSSDGFRSNTTSRHSRPYTAASEASRSNYTVRSPSPEDNADGRLSSYMNNGNYETTSFSPSSSSAIGLTPVA